MLAELEHNVLKCIVYCFNINSRIERFFINDNRFNWYYNVLVAFSVVVQCNFQFC